MVQFKMASAPASELGKIVLLVTKTVSVATQPPATDTDRIYVPEALTVGVNVAAPLTILPPMVDQKYVAPGVDDVPLSIVDVVVHVSCLSVPAFTFGEKH